jgi:hypothetical protein
MRVDAHIPLVVVFPVGTPHRLEVEEVEVEVRLKLLDEFH